MRAEGLRSQKIVGTLFANAKCMCGIRLKIWFMQMA
jgi:hypothetical protein